MGEQYYRTRMCVCLSVSLAGVGSLSLLIRSGHVLNREAAYPPLAAGSVDDEEKCGKYNAVERKLFQSISYTMTWGGLLGCLCGRVREGER